MKLSLGRILYKVGVSAYHLAIRISSSFNSKAKNWILGRENSMKMLKNLPDDQRKTVWFHCASLGEFEQGRPLIEKWRRTLPESRIVLTFFSPSGYLIRKNYEHADLILYLPADSKENARFFLERIQPDAAIFIKYEFWASYLEVLAERKIPSFLISAIFRERQIFFSWYGTYFRKLLKTFTAIQVQDAHSQKLLRNYNIESSVFPDLRFDRVLEIGRSSQEVNQVKEMASAAKLIVAGSTWPADESILEKAFKAALQKMGYRLVIAPHEIQPKRIRQLEKRFEGMCSKLSDKTRLLETPVLIIDSIGLLSTIYKYSHISYIGGGFGRGIHNTLEAAVYGRPLLFGPKYHQFKEAVDLINAGAALTIRDKASLVNSITRWEQYPEALQAAGQAAVDYVKDNTLGTEAVWNLIQDKLSAKT